MNWQSVPDWRRVIFLQRAILLALLGGLGLLLVEIRYEHQAVLGEKWQSWIPIIYLLAMLVLMPLGQFHFGRLGGKLLMCCFAGLVIVGTLGFWLHTKGKPVQGVIHIVQVDLKEPGHLLQEASDEDTHPPLLAPLSLVGLGVIGILTCLLHIHGDEAKDEGKV